MTKTECPTVCAGRKMYYVMTAGGPYMADYSYDYLRALATVCFGIPETELIKTEMLDVEGFDAETLVNDTIRSLAIREEK